MTRAILIIPISVVLLVILVGVGYEVGKLIQKQQNSQDKSRKNQEGGSPKTVIPNGAEKNRREIYFPESYRTTGTITLPLDGIMEPFEAWFAGKHNMSRIDYYNGRL